MSTNRSRKEHLNYRKHLKTADPDICAFCPSNADDRDLIEETKAFRVIRNIFPYSIWDAQSVDDHLLLTPKKHTDSLSGMTSAQKVEYVDLVEKYEKLGYNIYSRAPDSPIKSIPHQHTHLIKNKGQAKRFLLLLRRPYYVRIASRH